MIYLVFLLIAGAAAVYLLYSTGNSPDAVKSARGDYSRMRERQAAIKLSLADLDYELSVGKLERADFERLQTELLLEWESIENKLASQAESQKVQENCPDCGATLVAEAKFCHRCGFRLQQWLVAFLLFVAFSNRSLSALDIRVEILNGTTQKLHSEPLKVQLLQLEKGMQPVSTTVAHGGKAEFSSLKENPAAPYMVQTEYRSVTYSKVIPPNLPSPVTTTLEIFESTDSPHGLRVRTLVELRRVAQDRLSGIMIMFFLNQNNRTFTGAGGIEFYLPEKATVEQASVSVGSGASNIQWLKVAAEKRNAQGLYRVAQSVKPGERILQVVFNLPYDENGTSIAFRSLYQQDTGLRLIVEPEDVEVFRNERLLVRSRDPSLERGLLAFTANEKEVVLRLAKGGIAPAPVDNSEVELIVRSPLETWQKIFFPVAAILIFFLLFWWREKRALVRRAD